MSSSSTNEQEFVQWANAYWTQEYIGIAAASMITYDYALNFTAEVDLFWCRKFSAMTWLYMTLRYLGMSYAIVTMTSALLNLPVSAQACYSLWAFRKLIVVIATVLLQGMMTLRAYVLLGGSRAFLIFLLILFIPIQGVGIISAFMMMKPVYDATSRINVEGLNVCETGVAATTNWVSPATNTLWIAYEVVLCSAVVRYAFKVLTVPAWKYPMQSTNTLISVIIRDNQIYVFIVFASMFVTTLNVKSVTGESPVLDNMSPFLSAFQYAMVGPWMIINLRRTYERNTNMGASSSDEITTVGFASAPIQRGAEDETWA